MTTAYYAGSSQPALRFDRVEHDRFGRGELGMLWLNPATEGLEAEVAWDAGTTTSVPLAQLVYLPPELEAVEAAQEAQNALLAELALEAAWNDAQLRLEALRLAVQALAPLVPTETSIATPSMIVEARAKLVTQLAESFHTFLSTPVDEAPPTGG